MLCALSCEEVIWSTQIDINWGQGIENRPVCDYSSVHIGGFVLQIVYVEYEGNSLKSIFKFIFLQTYNKSFSQQPYRI